MIAPAIKVDHAVLTGYSTVYRESHREAMASGSCEQLQECYVNTFSSWEDISKAFEVRAHGQQPL